MVQAVHMETLVSLPSGVTSTPSPTALPFLDAYKGLGFKSGEFPVASIIPLQLLSLPMFPELEKDEIEYITNAIRAL